jgi:hypothetical protein
MSTYRRGGICPRCHMQIAWEDSTPVCDCTKCPVCGSVYSNERGILWEGEEICPDCHEDLGKDVK